VAAFRPEAPFSFALTHLQVRLLVQALNSLVIDHLSGLAELEVDHAMQSNKPVEYWGFRIADLTGMRANEICQLELRDIRSMTWKGVCGIQEHIDYFDINEESEDQHVKSSCSVRRLPMPQALIEDGFLQYVEDVRKAGGKHVFPSLSWNEKRPGRALSSFVNPMFREVGITDRRKVLHSTRNTWTTQADNDSVPRSVVRAVNGHADGSDIDDNTYTARATLAAMKKSMEAMDIPYLQFRPYCPAHFAKAIKAGVAREKRDEGVKEEGKSLNRRAGRPKKETGAVQPAQEKTVPTPQVSTYEMTGSSE
jgi:integrase